MPLEAGDYELSRCKDAEGRIKTELKCDETQTHTLHEGCVFTANGIVYVLSSAFITEDHSVSYSTLIMDYEEHRYKRIFDKAYKPNSLITQAKKFAEELVGGLWYE